MVDKTSVPKRENFADWLMRGALSRIGDTVDQFTGRKWTPSSSLATSELIERIKKLLDAEAKQVPGKGAVVPHNIKLRMQWDKFSTDADEALAALRTELLVAAVDHINDSMYYTYAPVVLEVKPDYFIEGVKLFVSFERFGEDEPEVEMNVTVPSINVTQALADPPIPEARADHTYAARFEIKEQKKEKHFSIPAGGRISLGRIGSNDIVIDDSSVSKIHASIGADADGALLIADTGSTNGTFINDQRIAYGKATRLLPEDRVKFGTIEITFERTPTAQPSVKEDTVSIDGFEFTSRGPTDVASNETPSKDRKIEHTEDTETNINELEAKTETSD